MISIYWIPVTFMLAVLATVIVVGCATFGKIDALRATIKNRDKAYERLRKEYWSVLERIEPSTRPSIYTFAPSPSPDTLNLAQTLVKPRGMTQVTWDGLTPSMQRLIGIRPTESSLPSLANPSEPNTSGT